MFHWGVRNRQLTLSTSFPEWTGAAHPISDASSAGAARWVVFSGSGSFKASAARCRIRSINQQLHPQTLRSVASFVVGSVGRQMPMLLRQRTAKGLMSPLRQAIFFPGFHGCPRPPAPSLPCARGFSPGGLLSSSSCSMRLISFSGRGRFIFEGLQRQASMAAAKAWRCQTTKLWLSVQQYYVRVDVC